MPKAEQPGGVSVIVRLDVPMGLEAGLPSSGVARQRGALAEVQKDVLGQLPVGGVGDINRFKTIPYFAATVDDSALAIFAVSDGVLSITEDQHSSLTLSFSRPQVQAPGVHQYNVRGTGQTIAVIDTGFDTAPPLQATLQRHASRPMSQFCSRRCAQGDRLSRQV